MRKTLLILSAAALVLCGAATAERWPLGVGNVPVRVGNNCYEFQNYGSNSYYHDGLDCLGNGRDPCYAVANGYVSLISVSEPLYTGIIVNYTRGQDKGWLYWHITYSTIPFIEGDPVATNDRVGNIATWPVASFHHVHFTRSYYPGVSNWYDAIDNPIEFMDPGTDLQAPEIKETEAGQMFSFCEDNGDTRVDPNNVKGKVDIIARISDRIVDTSWDLVPYEIEWWINGNGGSVPPTKFLVFTGAVPNPLTVTTVVYKRSVLWYTQGNYDYREYYFVVTNTDGDGEVEVGDEAYNFDSTTLPNGKYTLYVQAKDYYGNPTVRFMDFTINNDTSDVKLKSLTARGVPRGVDVAWAAAEPPGVAYNLYRQEVGAETELGAAGNLRLNDEPISGQSPYSYRDASAEPGVTYEYRLEAVELSGARATFGPVEAEAGVTKAKAFALHGAAPNPARGEAVFSFALPHACRAQLHVYDMAGRKVATVVDGNLAAGEHSYPTPLSLSPGVYVYRLRADDFVAARKLVVVR